MNPALEKKCRVCGATLVLGVNWAEGNKRKRVMICNSCVSVRNAKYQQQYKEKNSILSDNQIYNGSLKRCSYCKEKLPKIKQYWHRNNTTPEGLYGSCIECEIIVKGKSYAKKKGYRLDPGNITGKELRILKTKGCYFNTSQCRGELVLEHNHITGKIRGYVCSFHNTGLVVGLEEMAILKSKEEMNRWLQWIFNPPAKSLYTTP